MLRLVGPSALVGLLLFAGCAAPPPSNLQPGVEPHADQALLPLVFDPPRPVMSIPNTGHEAFLEVSPDGQTLLSCAHGDFRAPAHMYASTDGGATFRELDAGPTMLPAGDCEVALGPAGAWSFSGKTALGITVATTKDQGVTWTINHAALPPLNGLADRQWLAYAGSVLVLSAQPGSQDVGNVLVTRSTDFGATWSQPVEVIPVDPAAPGITAGNFLIAPDNITLRIPALRGSGPVTDATGVLLFAVSRDAGQTWIEEPVGPGPSTAYPTGAAQATNGVLTWAYAAANGDMHFIVSVDDGSTWSAPVTIGTGHAHERPWASARPDGTVDVLWLSDGSAFGGDTGLAVTRLNPRLADPVLAASIISDVAFIEFASVAHDASGRAHVVVVDAPRLMGLPPQAVEAVDGGRLLLVQEAVAVPA